MLASGCVRTLFDMAAFRQASPAQRRHAASLRRDGALNRLSSITAATVVATTVIVGALVVYVGKALPGHQSGASSGTTTATVPSGVSGSGTGASNSPNSLNPPSSPPTAASAPPPVTSGAT